MKVVFELREWENEYNILKDALFEVYPNTNTGELMKSWKSEFIKK